MTIEVHTFEQTTDAYEACQAGEVKDGDVLICTIDGVIGFYYKFWPVFVVAGEIETVAGTHLERGVFHYPPGGWWGHSSIAVEYAGSIEKCLEVAHSDGDITGNEHWTTAADPRKR